MKQYLPKVVAAAVGIVIAAVGYYVWLNHNSARLPDDVASGNGRIEAEEVHVASKRAGRVISVEVDEGDTVEEGQILARLDSSELEASLASAEGRIEQAKQSVGEARALSAQRKAELTFAESELKRAQALYEKGHVTKVRIDQRKAGHDAAKAALEAANAGLARTEHSVDTAEADARRIRTQLDDLIIKAPRSGRVQYRLMEPGEVVSSGGRIVTLLDLTDVYMTIFLPTRQVGRLLIGSDARIILDAVPQYVIPAIVSFVDPQAQFTPREVETRTERERLMFRVKVKINPDLLKRYAQAVKTGLPGEAFVALGAEVSWPEHLTVKLPPSEGS